MVVPCGRRRFRENQRKGIRGNCAEVRVGVEGLQKLGGAHGFAESVDALGMTAGLEEVKPLTNVVSLEESIGGELAATRAVCAGVRKEDDESVCEEELRVSGRADAVVGNAVKEKHCACVGMVRLDEPGTQDYLVWSRDGDVGEVGIEGSDGIAHGCDFFLGEWATGGVKGSVGYEDADDRADGEVDCEG
jgi:hypothetical protein